MNKYLKGRLLAMLFCTSISYPILSQESIRPEISVIPPSPNAAAINKFVEVPVSYYTGTPNVSIPLFRLQVEGMSLPISLDYHASGLKVEEHASNVGAGWRLNAGGVITRSIQGLPDEVYSAGTHSVGEQRGWFQTTFVESPNTSQKLFEIDGTLNCDYINSCDVYYSVHPDGIASRPVNPRDHLAGGNWDLEPDTYHLSYPGGSSKFIFEREGDLFELIEDDIVFNKYPFTSNSTKRCTGCPAITADTDPTNTDYSFSISDPNGISYHYGDVERTTAVSDCFPNDPDDNNGVSNRQSAWYLSQMSVGTRSINFTYDDEIIYYESDFYETKQFKLPGSTGTVDPTSSTCMNDMTAYAKRIESITTSNGYEVLFVPESNSRNDLDGSKAIKEIIIKYDGVVIKHYKLIHSYFGSNDKLKLDEVQIVDPNHPNNPDKILNKYDLQYYSGAFPSIDSKDQDYWGYYNGAGNSSLIPEWKNASYHVNTTSLVDRDPNLLPARTGTLEKITYPTGGWTHFQYELNDFYSPDYEHTYTHAVSAVDGQENNPVEDVEMFTIDAELYATLKVTYETPPEGPGGLDGIAQLEIKDQNGNYGLYTPPASVGNRIILEAGDYRLYASSQSELEYTAEIEYELEAVEKFVKAGGLRISRMTFHDPVTGKNEYRYFEYTQDGVEGKESSGKLYTDPRIGGYTTTATTGTVGTTCQEDGSSSTTFVNLSAISQIPLGVSQGSPVGYSRVRVFKTNGPIAIGYADEDKINGETIYEYENDAPNNQAVYPPVPPEDRDYKNGKVKLKQVYKQNESGQLVQLSEEVNSYEDAHEAESTTSPYVVAYMFRKIANRTCYECNSANTIHSFYNIYRRWNRIEEKIEKTIENEELTKTTSFSYANRVGSVWPYHQTTYMKTEGSQGEDVEFFFTRHASYPGLITMLSEKNDGVLVRAEKVDYTTDLLPESYKIWDGKTIIPEEPEEPVAAAFIEKQFIERNTNGKVSRVINNPQTTSYNNEIATIYIRSYDELERVVAEITGISQNELNALLTANSIGGIVTDLADDTDFTSIETKLDSIRQVLKPHHLMTTYLYDNDSGGIHGPTNIIDPSGIEMKYKYDEYGRLEYVFDAENNLVRKVSYNYKNKED